MKNRLLNHDERLENIRRQLEIALNSPKNEIIILEEVIKELDYILQNEREVENSNYHGETRER